MYVVPLTPSDLGDDAWDRLIDEWSRYKWGSYQSPFRVRIPRHGNGPTIEDNESFVAYHPNLIQSIGTNWWDYRRKLTIACGIDYDCDHSNAQGVDGITRIDDLATLPYILTADIWTDRLLGVNKSVTFPLTFVTMATANNIRYTSDMIRRTVTTKLQSDMEDPSTRNEFLHADLLDYAKRNRAQLVTAALSIPYHYIQASRPDQHLPEFGTYEKWSALVRSSLVWAGYADCDTRKELAATNEDDTGNLRLLIDGFDELGGEMTVAEAIEKSEKSPSLTALLKSLPNHRERDEIGTMLRDNKNRNVGGKRIVKVSGGRVAKWKIEKVQ